VVHVRRALQRVRGGGLRFLELKTRKSRRDIALPQVVLAALQAHKDRQAFERRAADALWPGGDLVFASTIGTPLEPRNINRHFARVQRRAGLPRLRFHDLRHACATLLLLQGVELKVVQEVLGHASISTTGNIYAHVLHSLMQGAAQQIDAVLSGQQVSTRPTGPRTPRPPQPGTSRGRTGATHCPRARRLCSLRPRAPRSCPHGDLVLSPPKLPGRKPLRCASS
jgi:integrase